MKTNYFYQSLNHVILSILIAIGILFLSSFPQIANAQTLTVYADSVAADKGDTIAIDIRVVDFKEIFSLIFAIQWDETVLEFIELKDLAPLPFFSLGNFNLLQTNIGVIRMAWFDATISGRTLNDNAVLYTLYFKVIGERGTTSEIDIGDYFSFKAEATTLVALINLVLKKGSVQVKQPPIPESLTPTIPIPTLNQWGLLILGLLVLNVCLVLIYRQIRSGN